MPGGLGKRCYHWERNGHNAHHQIGGCVNWCRIVFLRVSAYSEGMRSWTRTAFSIIRRFQVQILASPPRLQTELNGRGPSIHRESGLSGGDNQVPRSTIKSRRFNCGAHSTSHHERSTGRLGRRRFQAQPHGFRHSLELLLLHRLPSGKRGLLEHHLI